MPRNKDLKRLVRSRMRKTGEAYTAARAQIISKSPSPKRPSAAPARAASPAAGAANDYAALAGFSDETIKEKTGCTWDKWVFVLDKYGAVSMSHGEITKLISSKYRKVPGWWTQGLAVGYERIKGLRARGQRRDGTYEASKSRTFDVPVDTLFDAWADARTRKRWLDVSDVKVRTATKPKSIRLGWNDGRIVAVWFTAKGKDRSTASVQHTRLPDRETAEHVKVYWARRFDALAKFLKAR
jgi:hypothetical protein